MRQAPIGGRAAFLGVLLALLVVWLGALQPWDPDTWWHLRTGRMILETGIIPRADPYSYVLDGGKWVTFEWLSEILFYLSWKLSPLWGLPALKTALAAAGMLGIWAVGGAGVWSFLTLALVLFVEHGFLSHRPQLFDYVFLPLFLWLLREERPRRLHWACLPLVCALWANLHGGAAFLGAGLLGLRAALTLLPESPAGKPAGLKAWAGLAAACAAAVFLTPHGLDLLGHTAGTLLFKNREVIGEWMPLTDPFSWHGLFLAAGACAVAVGWREEPALAASAAALGLMSTSAVRHTFLYCLAAAPLCARLLERRRPLSGWRPAAAAAGAAAAVSCLLVWRFAEFVPPRPGDVLQNPEEAVRWLDEQGVEGRMFHSYELGGYLIWRSWPRRKVFVDGRNVEYGPAFITRMVSWQHPLIFPGLDADWKFDYAVLVNGLQYKARVLDEDPRWALTFWDDAGLVYLKRNAANAALIKKHGFALLKPNQQDFGYLAPLLADKKKAPLVMAEIERSVSLSPFNLNARQMKAFALDQRGRAPEALEELRSAAERFADKPSPHMALGWWYERNGRLPEAREAYRRGRWAAQRIRDRFSEAYILNNLAMVEARLGERDEAIRLLRRALRLWPLHPNAAANLSRLEQQ